MVSLILKVISVIICVVILAFVINKIENYKKSKKISIPFKEAMDLLNVPVVTFMNNGFKLHFLLDTGGDYSYINKNVLPALEIKGTNNDTIKVTTGAGSMQSEGKVTFDISYKDYKFEETFVVQDLASQLESAFGPYGITVHGILGSIFFAKHQYEINFEDFTAYSKQ